MGHKKRTGPPGDPPRRGKRRSIRYEAVQDLAGDGDRRRDPDKPPEILLRKLTLAEAMERLEVQLRAYAAKGRREVVVVHGKGQSSIRGIPVLGPAVREWCSAHVDLVASWREAPTRWGGAGAIVVQLRTD